MLKKLLLLLTFFYAAMSFAAVDVNQASAAELDSIKGIGPAISGKILDERKKGALRTGTTLLAGSMAWARKTPLSFPPKA